MIATNPTSLKKKLKHEHWIKHFEKNENTQGQKNVLAPTLMISNLHHC